jgi:hypothetical protein
MENMNACYQMIVSTGSRHLFLALIVKFCIIWRNKIGGIRQCVCGIYLLPCLFSLYASVMVR